MATFSNRPQNTIKEKLLSLTKKNISDPFIRQKKIFNARKTFCSTCHQNLDATNNKPHTSVFTAE
jgi:hypothetical protein